MARAQSKTTKIVRSTVKEARRDLAQVGKTAAAASKAVRAVAKVFIKPAPARELSQINKLLGEEFTSLRSARAALKQQSKPAKPVKGYTLPAGVVIKRPAAGPQAAAAAPPAPPPVLPLPKPPGKPGESIFSTRQLPGGITQDDVTRGLMELGDEGLAQKMDALLRPGEQWCFFIQNPQTGHFFRSGVLYPSWSAMVRDIRGRYKDLGPNAMQALKFVKVGGGGAVPQRQLSSDEYEELLRKNRSAIQEAREEYRAARKAEALHYREELAKRGIYPGGTMMETFKSFRKVFEREERLKAAAAEERAAERKAARREKDRERRARLKAERAAAEARKQAGISKRKETLARKREAALKAERAAERKRAAKQAAAARKREAAAKQRAAAERKRAAALVAENKKLKRLLKAAQARGGRPKVKRRK